MNAQEPNFIQLYSYKAQNMYSELCFQGSETKNSKKNEKIKI